MILPLSKRACRSKVKTSLASKSQNLRSKRRSFALLNSSHYPFSSSPLAYPTAAPFGASSNDRGRTTVLCLFRKRKSWSAPNFPPQMDGT